MSVTAISTVDEDVRVADADRLDASGLRLGVRRSLLWSLAAPTCVAVAVLVTAIGYYTPHAVVDAALDDAVLRAEHTAQQMQTLRTFYSDNVVTRATSSGSKASPRYRTDGVSIPVPTTFILDVAEKFSNEDVKVRLVSPYPWPMREGRQLDAFQKEAWDHLVANPKSRFVRREVVDGREVLRVAVADSMGESCVACHNTNALSPKQDWKVGDVRGLIEVDRPIDSVTQGARNLSWSLVAGTAVAGVLLLGVLLLIGLRLVHPLRELSRVIKRIAKGQHQDSVPHVERSDELGTVARALLALQEQTQERARAEARISHMAHHDALTGLPNRVQFQNELEAAIERLPSENKFAVHCLDLDHFKAVNDTLGHPVGDGLLIEVARRLQACIRDTDRVARLGGDEFAVLQIGADLPSGAKPLADRIIQELSGPYDILGHHIVIGASIGIAVAPDNGLDVDQLLKSADMALYRAKSDGRGAHRFFEAEMDAKMQARRALELDLRAALSSKEFVLHYQPLISLTDNRVCGCEALLRWRHPTRGMVSPAEFVPIAEEIGAIDAIGAWVLHTACREAARWPADVKVAVNLSPIQFQSKGLVLNVVSALGASGLPANRLELEITEAVMLQDTQATLATLHHLRDLGVSISMDDFGTGYSSLSYLRKFPFDKIKIDQCFVRDMSDADDSVAIVRAVASLGVSFGMSTTAEGVETREQLERLRAEGCSEAQGYLFSPPRPAHEVRQMFKRIHKDFRRAS